MNWLKYLVGLSAILVAGCAAYFSVTGLGVLFSGASASVMLMAGSLEFAKLVAATYLKQTWDNIGGFNKWYLAISVGTLMLITSAGIFGYLSNAFQKQNLKLDQIQRDISVYDTKIKQNESEIARYTEQIKNLQQIRNSQETNISKIVDKNGSTSRISQMVSSADKEISQISQKINTLTEQSNKNHEEINKIKTDNIETEKEVGGFRFVAEAFGVDLNTVVKFFIFLIVFVFDPLAIALIIAFNGLIIKKKDEIGIDTIIDDGGISDYIRNKKISDKTYEVYGETPQTDAAIIEEEMYFPGQPNAALIAAAAKYKTEENTNYLKWEEWLHPDFPWDKFNMWINNPKAVQYWIKSKGGSVKELSKIKNDDSLLKNS